MRQRLEHLREQLRRILTRPTEDLTRLQATVRYAIDLSQHCYRELIKDRAAQMAAALTYHTLFSILPTIVVMLVVLQGFVSEADREQYKQQIVAAAVTFLQGDVNLHMDEQVRVIDGEVHVPEDVELSPEELRIIEARLEFDMTRQRLDEQLQFYLEKLETVNFRGIGVVGVLLFIYGATGLLSTIEKSFNSIFGVSFSRPIYIRVPLYYTVITLGPLVIIAGQFLQGQVFGMLQQEQWTTWLVSPLIVLSPLLTVWLFLFLLFVLLPNTRVRVRPAAIGSFVSAVGWVICIELFRYYVRGYAYATIYGALGLLPLFLMWMWVSWMIVLFGLELTYTLQAMPGKQFKNQPKPDERDAVVDPRWVIPIMALVGQSFTRGQTIGSSQLARQMGLPLKVTTQLIEQLHKAGLLHRVDDNPRGQPGYTLARPAEEIAIDELLTVGDQLVEQHLLQRNLPGRKLLDQFHDTEHKLAGDFRLASLLQEQSEQAVAEQTAAGSGRTIAGDQPA